MEDPRGAPAPSFLQIEPVGQCNLRCRMCAIAYRDEGRGTRAFLDFDLYTRLVDEALPLEELHLQGLGEPLLHPRFFEMVAYAADRGVKVSTNTNLVLLRPETAERCVSSGLDSIHVSIDGASAATYEAIRKRARLARVLGNLELLMEARRRARRDTPAVRLVMVLMRANLHELADVVRLAHRHGVRSMFVQHLSHGFGEDTLPERYVPMRGFVEAESLSPADAGEVAHAFAAAREVARTLGVALRLPRVRPRAHPPGTPGRARCDWPWRGAYLAWSGDAMPCCMVGTPDRCNLGSAAANGLREVWDGAAYREFRARLDSEEPPAVCRSCSLYHGTF